MKKELFFLALLVSSMGFSQTQPTVHNGTFDKIPKSSGSDCACSGWINKDIADQGESTTASGNDVVKLDDLESDGIYQEIAVEANSNYSLDFEYTYRTDPTTTTHIEVLVLKGSGYVSMYTPAYADPATAAQDGFGYQTIAAVETVSNQLAKTLITPPGDTSKHSMTTLSFDTGTETSIAIFIRAVGPYDAGNHGDPTKDKGWMNGDSEIQGDNLTLVNNGLSVSYTPTQPTVHNGTFDKIPKSSGSDCACSGWINKDIADQGESTTASGNDVVKLDDLESDGIYQEIAVEANSNYSLDFEYTYRTDPTTTTHIEVLVLKGSGYVSMYTPAYADPATAAQDGFGYQTIAAVETVSNQLAKTLITPPGDTSKHSMTTLSFDTGTETSIAIFIRAVGPYDAANHGDPAKDKGWMNGDSEIQGDNLTLVNNGYSINSWTGNTSSVWNLGANWSLGTIPNEFNRVVIGNETNKPVIGTTGAKAYNLYVASGSGATLNIASGGSLIVEDLYSGEITYKRTLTADADPSKAWHLLSSPVSGQTVVDFIANNTLASGTTNTDFRGIANYKNDGTDWNYYLVSYTGADAFDAGKGYSVKNATASDVTFTGTYTNGNKDFSISQATNNFNLTGNPYAAYINLGTFFTDNNAVDRLSEQTIWLWDQSANAGNGGYVQKMAGTDAAFQIAPGQGFFVSAGTAASNKVTFNATNQSHQTDSFLRSSRPEVHLNIVQNDLQHQTKIYYIEGTTTGFDNGYDGSMFGGVSYDLAVFTELVANGQDERLGIQSLPDSDYENMIIPVGLIAEADSEITFSAETMNLPTDLKVFLEDKEANIFTRLDETNTEYTVTVSETLDGVGRFYIHTSESALTVDDATLNTVHVYKSDVSTVRIVGLPHGNTTVKLFNILGKEILNTTFEANGVKDIFVSKLATGIYMVKVQTELGTLNKKIILEY